MYSNNQNNITVFICMIPRPNRSGQCQNDLCCIFVSCRTKNGYQCTRIFSFRIRIPICFLIWCQFEYINIFSNYSCYKFSFLVVCYFCIFLNYISFQIGYIFKICEECMNIIYGTCSLSVFFALFFIFQKVDIWLSPNWAPWFGCTYLLL